MAVTCPFCLVGVGASAGGLEAFTEVLRNLPAHTGLGFVFVQHLDPRHESLLAELLQRSTKMAVVQAADGTEVQPDCAYVIPPNVTMTIENRILRLKERPEAGQQMPVDTFFRSLAVDLGMSAIGVVLSGTASDGTAGLKCIKDEGGITFAQDPETARFDGMPRSAISSGCVDFVLAPAAIAVELARISRHPYITQPVEPEPVAASASDSDRRYAEIFSLLRSATNVDFTFYKHGTIRRRVYRRMALHKIDTLDDYIVLLRERKDELNALFQDILINVTSFFREPATFELLAKRIFPELKKQPDGESRASEAALRIWVPGCSSGEDVYSVAITLLETLGETPMSVQIFGTDLSESVLERARTAIYPESISAEVSEPRLRRFFNKVSGGYQINRNVREMCIFARQNLTHDAPFSRIDLLVCRNVLIYLGPELQKRAMRLFRCALKPTGYLVLGESETIGTAGDLFTALDRHHRVYKPRDTDSNTIVDLESWGERILHPMPSRKPPVDSGADLQRRMDQTLLARYTPPSVLVNRDLRILHFRGPANKFLEHSPGEATLQVMKMARSGLAPEIRNLIQEADRTQAATQSKVIAVPVEGTLRDVRLSVAPVDGSTPEERQFLVVFETVSGQEMLLGGAAAGARGKASRKKSGSEGRIQELEQELTVARRYLQSIAEDQETITEELKSANEEIQSSNEELQSTNEELLTAKEELQSTNEELQSTNEELTTVNEEMQSRNDQLVFMNSDLYNLLSSVNIPIVMLSGDLKIRRFTPQAEKILNLRSTDIGRPVGDFKLKINMPDMEKMVRGVMASLVPAEREVQDSDGRAYTVWVRPYRTVDNRIDGAVLSMFDLTESRQIAEMRFRRLFEASVDGIVICEAVTGEILEANPFACRLLGRERREMVGRSLFDTQAFHQADVFRGAFAALKESDKIRRDVRFRKEDGEWINIEITARAYDEGERRVVQLNLRDGGPRLLQDAARELDTLGREM